MAGNITPSFVEGLATPTQVGKPCGPLVIFANFYVVIIFADTVLLALSRAPLALTTCKNAFPLALPVALG